MAILMQVDHAWSTLGDLDGFFQCIDCYKDVGVSSEGSQRGHSEAKI